MKFILKSLRKNNLTFQGGLFLFGAIVGVGVFTLPFIVYQSGLIKGMIVLVLVGLISWLLNLAYAQLILASGENCQLASYGRKYWGRAGGLVGSLTILININGTLLVYLIGTGDFLYFLFPWLTSFFWGLIFFIIAFWIMVFGLKSIARVNTIVVWLLILLLVSFFFWGAIRISPNNFAISPGNNLIQLFSVFFFSYAGAAVIPELGEILKFERKPVFRAITVGSLLPGILYGLFIVVGLGLLGGGVSEEFIFGLSNISLVWARIMAALAILAIISSFFAFGFTLKEFWHQDLGFSQSISLIFTFLPSLLFYLFGSRDFLGVIIFTGGVSCLLMILVILSCWLKEKKWSRS
ncbi:MAG: aromatic amino acid transport family protein [Candidatus Shapirobacteria bacterium]|nr:aromatic amino acid transport family protein [Candidatus Shapirobacteria bacterium]